MDAGLEPEGARQGQDEIRLRAELDGEPVGFGVLVVENSDLRACYTIYRPNDTPM